MEPLDRLAALLPKPKRPAFEDVWRVCLANGGTKEMAQAFYDKWEAVGWYKVNPTQPITNYVPLLQMFIRNWNTNDNRRKPTTEDALKDW